MAAARSLTQSTGARRRVGLPGKGAVAREKASRSFGTVISRSRVEPGSHAVQVHLWLRAEDARCLKTLASERDQTMSAVVRSLLKCALRR